MATLHCEIITPEGTAFSGEAEMVVVPGTEGELGVLPRHQPIVAHLDVGQIRVKVSASEWRAFASSDGYFSMQNNRALVLVEGAVPSDQIDVEAAQALAEDRADYAYRLCTSRGARPAEVAALRRLLEEKRARLRSGELKAAEIAFSAFTKTADLPADATPADLAAWAIVARVLLNLDETLVRP